MGSPVEYWSRCNEKFSSIIKSTSLSLLLTTLIFLSVTSAPAEEPRRCYWCGPLAEQVHRSRRARPCAAPLQETVCDEPRHYCATVAVGPPYTESRLCVKKYQDECYSLYCNTTRTYKMTCPCRGDFCNGPNTPREDAAFKQLRQLAASSRIKRFIQGRLTTTAAPALPPMNSFDNHSASDQIDLLRNSSDETSISTLNNLEKTDDNEVTGMSADKTHGTIVTESDLNNEVEENKTVAMKEMKRSEIQSNASVDIITQTDNETSADEKLTVTNMNISTIEDINSTTGFNQTIANQHTNVTEGNKITEPNDTSIQQTYQSITTEQANAYSTEKLIVSSEKPSDGDNLHLRNEIPTEHEVDITEVPAPKIPTNNKEVTVEPDTTTQIDHETNSDKKLTVTNMDVTTVLDSINSTMGFNETIANQHANVTPEDNKLNEPNDTFNQEMHRSFTTEQSTTYSTEVNVISTIVPAPENPMNETNHDMKGKNKDQRLNTSEASLNEINITADEMDTNFDESCNKTQSCNVNEPSTAHTEESKKTDKETQSDIKGTMVTLPEIKEKVPTENPYMNTAAIEVKVSTESKNSFHTQKPAIAATTNQDKPLESSTSVFTTLPSKVVTSTEAISNLGIKKAKQTSKKNNAFTVSGSILLLAHTFVVVVAL